MNAEQIAKLKELAQTATPGPWATDDPWIVYAEIENELVYLANTSQLDTTRTQYPKDAAFIAAANPAVILELIAMAEHSLSAQDEVLTDEWRAEWIEEATTQSGFTRKYACCQTPLKYCESDEWRGNIEGFAKALLRVAAPSPAVAVEPLVQEFASYIIKNHPKWHKDWACKRCAPESEILKDGFSCTLHKAHDALGDAKCKACEGMGRIATDDGSPGDAMSHRAPEPPTMERCMDCDGKGYFAPSPSLAVRDGVDENLAESKALADKAIADVASLYDQLRQKDNAWDAMRERAEKAESRVAEIQRGVEEMPRFAHTYGRQEEFKLHPTGSYIRREDVLALLAPQGQASDEKL